MGTVKNRELSIIVYSCWKNRDMWPIFIKLFKKYWNDCLFHIILLTDRIENDKEQVDGFDDIVVLDGNWYQMLMAGCEIASGRYVMLFMDDYLLCDYVNNYDIIAYLDLAEKYHAGNIRLTKGDFSRKAIFFDNSCLYQVTQGSAYSISTQVGIWSVEFLKKYIKPEWSAWDFERKGSIEINDTDFPILETLNYAFPYIEGVRRGKWMLEGVKLCERNGIRLDNRMRPVMTNLDMAKVFLKGAILDINPTLFVRIQNKLPWSK